MVTCQNQASFQRLMVAWMRSCRQTSVALTLRTHSLDMCCMQAMQSSLKTHLCSNACILHSVST
ncbi:hypothetical protein DPMN_105346 [Dreissena polymorpha]|uniref:Uncharacterized protein n=1 Tax=Dreissena polymorpha TaxID=45954 RepID=A0A9D4K0U9_DREPO|nr:hypothetical protein DPMN_105346 [Dreissena polymorpha]